MFIKMFSIEKKIHKKNKEHEKDKVNRKQEEEAVVAFLFIQNYEEENKESKVHKQAFKIIFSYMNIYNIY